jgi:hypothetical protein
MSYAPVRPGECAAQTKARESAAILDQAVAGGGWLFAAPAVADPR